MSGEKFSPTNEPKKYNNAVNGMLLSALRLKKEQGYSRMRKVLKGTQLWSVIEIIETPPRIPDEEKEQECVIKTLVDWLNRSLKATGEPGDVAYEEYL